MAMRTPSATAAISGLLPNSKQPAPSTSSIRFAAPRFAAPRFAAPRFAAPRFGAPRFAAPRFAAPRFAAPWTARWPPLFPSSRPSAPGLHRGGVDKREPRSDVCVGCARRHRHRRCHVHHRSDCMRLSVAIDQRFAECGGHYYTDLSFPFAYWREYTALFVEVCPIARVYQRMRPPADSQRADGTRVSFLPIVNYVGFWSLLRHGPQAFWQCGRAVHQSDAILLRWGLVGAMCWPWVLSSRRPYGFECGGHAGESVRRVKNIHILGLHRVLARIADALCAQMAKRAACAAYVSREVQRRYPSGEPAREWCFSSVRIDREILRAPRQVDRIRRSEWHVVSVGRLEPEKGHIHLVRAVAELRRRGLHIRLTLVGPGREIVALRSLASQLQLDEHFECAGMVPWGAELWRILDDADLFVIPSLTEGLPRALVEAMARGVPSIGTNVGGIPELLPADAMVAPGDDGALAERIATCLMDPERLAAWSAQGFAKAQQFRSDRMDRQKNQFWRCLINETSKARRRRRTILTKKKGLR